MSRLLVDVDDTAGCSVSVASFEADYLEQVIWVGAVELGMTEQVSRLLSEDAKANLLPFLKVFGDRVEDVVKGRVVAFEEHLTLLDSQFDVVLQPMAIKPFEFEHEHWQFMACQNDKYAFSEIVERTSAKKVDIDKRWLRIVPVILEKLTTLPFFEGVLTDSMIACEVLNNELDAFVGEGKRVFGSDFMPCLRDGRLSSSDVAVALAGKGYFQFIKREQLDQYIHSFFLAEAEINNEVVFPPTRQEARVLAYLGAVVELVKCYLQSVTNLSLDDIDMEDYLGDGGGLCERIISSTDIFDNPYLVDDESQIWPASPNAIISSVTRQRIGRVAIAHIERVLRCL